MIIEEYNESLFISRFEDYKRVVTPENPNGNFSYKGLRSLFKYLDELSDNEHPLNLDVISLCCDFSEYNNLDEYIKDYKNQHEDTLNEPIKDTEEFYKQMEEEINDKTTLIKFGEDLNEGFIIEQY